MDMRGRMKVKSIGVLSLLVLFLNGCLSGALRPKDVSMEKRAWFGWGEATGKYEETDYGIDEGVKGLSYEAMWDYQLDTKQSRFSRTRGMSTMKTDFVNSFDGMDGSRHSNHLTLLHPFVYHIGYGRGYKPFENHKFSVSADIFGGLGLASFTKDYTGANGSTREYPRGYGIDLLYGIGLLTIYEYDENISFGWHRMNMQNKVKLDFDEDVGYLTQYNSTVFFVGFQFSGQSCVDTAYVSC